MLDGSRAPRCIASPRGRHRASWWILALLCVMISVPAMAAKRSYRYEDDPIRLGTKALAENRLEDARKHFDEAITNEYQVYKARFGLGEILNKEGRYAEAETVYRQALIELNQETKGNRFPELHASLGLVLLRLGKIDEAKQALEESLSQKSGHWPAQYGLARIAIQQKNYTLALDYLEKGKGKKGIKEGEDQYRYGMALVQLAQGETAEAEKNALNAFFLNPSEPEYGTLVAEIYEKGGARTMAIEAYEKALATPGMIPTAKVLHSLGALYQAERRFNLGLERYQAAVQLDSTYAPAFKDMAALYALAKRYEDSAAAYLRYTQLRPDDSEAYQGLAEACLKTNRLQQGLEAAEKAWGLDSTRVETRLTLARASYLNKDKPRAERLYASVTDSTKFEAADYLRLGQIKSEQKQFEPASFLLRRAMDMDSTLADAYFTYGLVKLNEKLPDSAAVYLEKAITLAPNFSGAYLNLAIALMQQKKFTEAIPHLRKATEMAPEYVQGHIFLGQALVQVDSLNAAQTEYKKARELDPKNGAALRGLGFIYLKRSDPGQSIPVLEEATTVDPAHVDGWVLLGQSYLMKGDLAGAARSFKKALEIKPDHEPAKKGLEATRQSGKGGAGAN